MSWLSDFFSGGKNPADAAMPYLNQIPGMEKGYLEPYINRGNQAANTLTPQFNQMSQDPAAFLESLMKGYEPSKAYQLARDETQRAAGNSAAAGGMRGSINDITNQARLTDSLLGSDMQQWIQNVLGIQTRGQAGLGNESTTGFNAATGLTSDLSNVLGTQGQLAFQGQANQNQSRNDLLSGLVKALGGVAGFGLPYNFTPETGLTGGGTVGGRLVSRFI